MTDRADEEILKQCIEDQDDHELERFVWKKLIIRFVKLLLYQITMIALVTSISLAAIIVLNVTFDIENHIPSWMIIFFILLAFALWFVLFGPKYGEWWKKKFDL